MLAHWVEAGMPEVELQRRVSGGQWDSISGHMAVLKEGDSGPCSWIMEADETADLRSLLKVIVWGESWWSR